MTVNSGHKPVKAYTIDFYIICDPVRCRKAKRKLTVHFYETAANTIVSNAINVGQHCNHGQAIV